MNRKKLTIGLFGFGCVGYGLYEVLQKTPGLKATLKKTCVKNPEKERQLPSDSFTYNKYDILNDEEINVVVELIDDADAAFEIVSEALKRGKAVVSANKKMIAEHFDELLKLQQAYNVPLLYEAACCASIPIVRNLEEYYDNDLLESIEGIVNGSTNYILTKTATEQLTYLEALADAQAKGYAETNPVLDTQGFDAKYKLVILLAHAFGIMVKPDSIFNLGIDKLGDTELNYAREKGYKIKLVAFAERCANEKIKAFVLPKFVRSTDKLFSVDDVFNGVKTKSVFSDSQFFMGKGAGAHPTASAVLSDISALTYDYRYEYKKLKQGGVLESADDIYLNVMLSFSDGMEKIRHHFSLVNEVYCKQNTGFVIGILTLSKIRKLLQQHENTISIVMLENAVTAGIDDFGRYQELTWRDEIPVLT